MSFLTRNKYITIYNIHNLRELSQLEGSPCCSRLLQNLRELFQLKSLPLDGGLFRGIDYELSFFKN